MVERKRFCQTNNGEFRRRVSYSQCQIVWDNLLNLLMFFSFHLVVETIQTKDVM